MKKPIFLIAQLLLITGCLTAGYDFSEYRNSPFQWVYPEYFYKAIIIDVEKSNPDETFSKIEFFGLSAYAPDNFKKTENQTNENTLSFKSDSSELFVVSLETGDVLMGTEGSRQREKDYYSAFSSVKEWYRKMYSLTPDIITETTPIGDLWLIHAKGMYFDDTNKIEIYKGDSFVAYVKYFKKDNLYLNMEMAIFHNKLPDKKFVKVAFRTSKINAKAFLETLE
ncbi:MAG: hypothetical protein KKD44_07295 [Proteobacteria bacterium]|nr:hypothetical protein [Pseudomonadota bacterium]